MFVIISAVLAVLLIFSGVMYLREKSRNSKLVNEFLKESDIISDSLNKLSHGVLNHKIEVTKSSLPESLKGGINNIKANFNKVTAESLERVCFVGTDAWFEGVECARQLGKRIPEGGTIAIVITSSLHALIMSQRYRSFTTTIRKEFPNINILGYFEGNANQDKISEYVKSIADKIDGIYISGNSAVSGVARGLTLARRVGEVSVVCHDLDETIVEAIHNGIVTDTIISLPYGQGHDSLIHLFNSINTGWKPYQPRLMQNLKTVTKLNLCEFWDSVHKEPKKEAFELEGKVKPMGTPSSRKRTIIAFCEDWNASVSQMVTGIEDAGKELENFNCTVKICVLNQNKNKDTVVFETAQKAIDEAEANGGLDGICSYVGFTAFGDYLNQFAKKGIKISTFNSEPLSLRSMIEWLCDSSEQLKLFTNEYKENLSTVSDSYRKISSSLGNVASLSSEQSSSIQKGADSVSEITGFIDRTTENELLEEKAVKKTEELSRNLGHIAKSFSIKVEGLKSMGDLVKKSVEKTQAIKQYSENIQAIIGMIDNISEQTNLLAFNAAVESTHAGEYGKGFKVISTEIRDLADQSVKSTQSIANLIEDMRKAVDQGIASNKAMMKTVNEQVSEISSAAAELSGISQGLLEDVSQVSGIVKQNGMSFQQIRASTSGITDVMNTSTSVTEKTKDTISAVNSEFGDMNEKIENMEEKLQQLSELVSIMEGSVSSFNA